MDKELGAEYGIKAEMIATAVKSLEVIAARQNSAQLAAVAAAMKQGKIAEAQPVFKSVADTYAAAPQLPVSMKVAAWLDLAAVALHGDRDAAVAALDRALALDPASHAALAALAHVRLEARELDAALPLLERLTGLADSSDNGKWKAMGFEALGILHHAKGQLPEAARHYEQAIERFRRLDDPLRLAEALGNFGLIHRRMKRYAEAERLFAEALKVWQEHKLDAETARTLGYIASVHFAMQDFDRAISEFAARSAVNQRLQDVAEEAADHANIGLAASRKGDNTLACRHFRLAQERYRAKGLGKELAAVERLLGQLGCAAAGARASHLLE